mgnify:CR=1 FL=1
MFAEYFVFVIISFFLKTLYPMHRNTSNFSSPGHFQTAFKNSPIYVISKGVQSKGVHIGKDKGRSKVRGRFPFFMWLSLCRIFHGQIDFKVNDSFYITRSDFLLSGIGCRLNIELRSVRLPDFYCRARHRCNRRIRHSDRVRSLDYTSAPNRV